MVLLLRFFGISRLVNLTFSCAYMLNTLFIASAMHRWMIASFCWIPFAILMILRYFYYHRKQDLLYSSIFLALSFLGGNFQTSFFVAFIVTLTIITYPSQNAEYKLLNRLGMLIFIGCISF